MSRSKHVRIAVLLAALFGALGFLGTGHFYAGRVRRGIILIIAGWVIIGIGFILLACYFMSGLVIPPPGYPRVEPPESALAFLSGALVLFIGFGGLWIWQILDARMACKQSNQQIVD